tara:strand:- start:15 stop:821 length:807 start_codon:yes stop_codon:yes gene_type:complete
MASQTTTSLASSFNNSSSQAILNRFEDFEYVGTCNVASLRFAFSKCRVLSKITGNFASLTNMQATFQYSGDVDFSDMQIGSSGSGFFRQTFTGTRISKIFNQNFFDNVADFGQSASSAHFLYLGTPSTPLDWGGYSGGMSEGFSNCTLLRHAYFQNFTPSSLDRIFNGCGSLETVSGINCTNVTNSGNAFRYAYSLSTLEISNMKISFSLEDCNFDQAGLVNVFTDLYDLTTIPSTATITITDNPGVADLTAANELIATAKDWTIVKT